MNVLNVYVRILRVHPDGGTRWDVGRVVRVPAELASNLIRDGHAELFRGTQREKAVIRDYEKAVT